METFFNEDNSGGVLQTKNGPVTFTMDGNEVCLRQTRTSHRLDGMDLSTLTMQYMYDRSNRLIRVSFLDVDDNPVECTDGYAGYRRSYDEDGEYTDVYFGLDGECL